MIKLIVISVVALYFVPNAVASAVFLLFLLPALTGFRSLVRILAGPMFWCFLALFLIGIGSGIYSGFPLSVSYNFMRDVYYLVQPLILTLVGYLLTKKMGANASAKALGYSIYTILVFYLLKLGWDLGKSGVVYSIVVAKAYASAGELASVLVFLILSTILAGMKLFSRAFIITGLVFAIFIVLMSGSRTALLTVVSTTLFLVVFKGVGYVLQYFFVFFLVAFALTANLLLNLNIDAYSEGTASHGLISLLNEFSIGSEIKMDRWRATEAYLGLKYYLTGDVIQILFGKGAGATISALDLFGDKFESIPFFHNGYITILLKTGIIGLFCYLVFLFKIIQLTSLKLSSIAEDRFIGLVAGCMFYLVVIRTLLVMGFYSSDQFHVVLLLLGFIFYHAHKSKIITVKTRAMRNNFRYRPR